MARLDDLRGVEVTVEVDGRPLKEYTDDTLEEDPRTKTCYVEATSGKHFVVKVQGTRKAKFRGGCLNIKVKVDGATAARSLINRPPAHQAFDTRVIAGFRVSDREEKPFLFSGLNFVSDGKMLNREVERVKRMGVIEVTIQHVNQIGVGEEMDKRSAPKHIDFLSEKASKGEALSHGVEYGKSRVVNGATYWKTEKVKGQSCPAANFLFKYRSNAALRSLLVIPRTPTPPPLEERTADTLSRAEIVQMQKALKAFKAKDETKLKIKRERTDDNPRPRKIARPCAGATQLELGGNGGGFRETPTSSLPPAEEREIIELD